MRTAAPALAPLFRSEMQVTLLGLLLQQPERQWTLGELTALLAAPASSVHRELARAMAAGVVARDARRRPHLYAAAEHSPAFEPLRDLLNVTAGVPQRLGEALSRISGVRAAAIHGSWAKGRIRADSDLDVIVVTDGDRAEVQRVVRQVARDIGRAGDASVVSSRDFAQMVADRNPFLTAIVRGARIDVLGDLEELAAA